MRRLMRGTRCGVNGIKAWPRFSAGSSKARMLEISTSRHHQVHIFYDNSASKVYRVLSWHEGSDGSRKA